MCAHHKKLSAWSYCNSRLLTIVTTTTFEIVWIGITQYKKNTMKVVVIPLTHFVYCAFFLELILYWEFNTCSDDNLIIFMSWFINFLPTNQNWVANRFYYKCRFETTRFPWIHRRNSLHIQSLFMYYPKIYRSVVETNEL